MVVIRNFITKTENSSILNDLSIYEIEISKNLKNYM